jgi:putative nucleotidyltransferase with HDIG domain
VNSAFYGFPGRINTITHAIVILGFGTVKNIVLTASIFDSFGGRGDGGAFSIEKFWLHSIGVGAAAKTIARHTDFRSLEECFLGGLLHDIGKIILNQYAKPEMAKVMKEVMQQNCLFVDGEKQALKTTHQEIGGWLAAKWNLPKDLSSAVEHHHYPPAASKEHFFMTSVVHAADVLARALGIGSGGDKKIPRMNQEAWERLNLREGDMQKLFAEIEEEVEKANVFLSIM